MKTCVFVVVLVAAAALGGTANALPLGVSGLETPELSVPTSAGDAATDRVSGTVQDATSRVRDLAREPVPSLLGPRDEAPEGVLGSAYKAFEDLVTAAPDEVVAVRGVATAADVFSAPGIDGGVPGVTFGRLGAAGEPQFLRVIR